MKDIRLSDLDLLSLSILVNLYEHQSASYVSQKLNIPAPKISRCLKHARELFEDELFIRRKYGLVPNEFSSKLYPIAKEIVESAKGFQSLHQGEIDYVDEHFEIVAPDLVSYRFPNALMGAIKEARKELTFNISSWTQSSLQEITAGEVALGVCCSQHCAQCGYGHEVNLGQYQNYLETIPLTTLDKLYLVCKQDHPILKQEITLESIADYPFVNTVFGKAGQTSHEPGPFQQYCTAHYLPLHTEIAITSVSSLFDYLRSSQALALIPYSAVFDMVNEIPELHACQLSSYESHRLYQDIKPPTLYLIKKKHNDSIKLNWLIGQLQLLIGNMMHA